MKPHSRLSELYKKLRSQPELMAQHSFTGLSKDEVKQCESHGWNVYQGKVREMILRPSDALMLHTDRLSAFDRFLGNVPYKGLILASINEFWLKKIAPIAKTHLISQPHPRVLTVQRAKPFKVEVVVRGYLAGSMMRAYQNGERTFCGVALPNDLKPYSKLPKPIITPTTKADVYQHDENTSADDVVKNKICTAKEWHTIESMALKIFELGQKHFETCGWLLADAKYEFGALPNGDVIVIDEVHTPDCCRLWIKDTYAAALKVGEAPTMLDKENVRRYLLSHKFSGHGEVPDIPASLIIDLAEVYLQVAEKLLGKPIMVSEGGHFHLEEIKDA